VPPVWPLSVGRFLGAAFGGRGAFTGLGVAVFGLFEAALLSPGIVIGFFRLELILAF